MSKQETAQQLRKVANFFQGLVQAADDIEAIGSMELATKEAMSELQAAVRMRDEAYADLASAKSEAKAVKAAAKDRAEKAIADAEAKVLEMLEQGQAQAEAKAKGIVDAATQAANEAVQDAAGHMSRTKIAAQELAAKTTAAAAELAATEAALKEAKDEHDKMVKAIDALKAKFKIEA